MHDYTITIDKERRRVQVSLPLPFSAMRHNGPLMATVHKVCGKDAVVDAVISGHLGCVAVRAQGDTSWHRELGLEVEAPHPVSTEHNSLTPLPGLTRYAVINEDGDLDGYVWADSEVAASVAAVELGCEGDFTLAEDEGEDDPPPEVWDAWAAKCECGCPECGTGPCGGVQAGGTCDQFPRRCDPYITEDDIDRGDEDENDG